MKKLLVICFTVLLIALGHEYAELVKVQSQIEWSTRIQLARELHDELRRKGPQVEIPTEKPSAPANSEPGVKL